MNANFNKAATSSQKIPPVIDTVKKYISENAFESIGRGTGTMNTMEAVLEARIALADLLGAQSPHHIIFTSGSTESLNILIGGLRGLGKVHLIISCFEHNAVARPANALANAGAAELSVIKPMVGELEKAISSFPSLPVVVVLNHASNVFGYLLPIEKLFRTAKQRGAYTILDASQTLGHIPVKMSDDIDAVAFTGHKGLRALPGSGGFAISSDFSKKLIPWKQGGTGSVSDLLIMPDFLPDKFEAGTPNTLGILALGAAADYANKHLEEIHSTEEALFQYLMESLHALPITIHQYTEEPRQDKDRTEDKSQTNTSQKGMSQCTKGMSQFTTPVHAIPVVSITVDGYDSSLLSEDLDRRYGIKTRSGLHCSPLAHRAMGTFPEGTLRLSLNSDNTKEEIDYLVRALKQLITEEQ